MKKKTFVTVFVSVLLLSSILGSRLTMSVNASAIHHVYPGESIQEAINSAQPRDTVFVHEGTYYQQVFVNKSLTLIGEDANSTIIEGVRAHEVWNVKISGFTIWRSIRGIDLNDCRFVTISGNIVTDNIAYGIFLENSRNNIISNNIILNNGDRGVYLRYSSNNTVSNNTVSTHNQYGVLLFHSSDNVVSDNTVSNSIDCGIRLDGASNNIFSGNVISKNTRGLSIEFSPRNTLRNNNMTGNKSNLSIDGTLLGHFIQDIDPSNIVEGKPVYYWVNQHNKQVPSDAGYVALVNSTNIIVKDLNIAKNRRGVLIAFTTNSTIMNVNVSHNYRGIHILESSNNSIFANTITSNSYGIYLYWSSNNNVFGNTITNNDLGISSIWCNNTIYHNNFINNTKQVEGILSSNVWDNGYPSGGNYWSDYPSVDIYSGPNQDLLGSDGIGDTPYVIDSDNQDNYPLMNPYLFILIDEAYVSDDRVDVGSVQTVGFHAKWAYNGSDVVGGSIYVNGTRYVTNQNGWISFNTTYNTVGKRLWTVTKAPSDGITARTDYMQALSNPSIIWDRIQIVEGGSSRAQTTITETETIWFKAIYDYDNSAFDGTMGTLYVNGSAMIWSTVKERWEYNCTFNTPGTRVFKISGVSDDQYGLATINDLAGAQFITWNENGSNIQNYAHASENAFWAQWWFWTIMAIVAMVVAATYFLRKRKTPSTPHFPPATMILELVKSTVLGMQNSITFLTLTFQ